MVMSGQVVGTVLAFGALSLNTRALGPSALGVLFLIQATCELTSKVLAFQNWQMMIKFGAEAQRLGDGPQLKAIWRFGFMLDVIAAAAAAAVAAALFLAAPGLIGLDAETGSHALFYAASLLFAASGTSTGALRLLDRFGLAVATNLVMAGLLLVNAAILYLAAAPLWVYLVAIPAISASTSLFVIVAGYRRVCNVADGLQAASGPGHRETSRRNMFRFAIGVSATSTLTAFRQRGELLIVGGILGPSAAALFGVAYRISALIARFGEAGRQSVYPEIAKLVADGAVREAAELAFRLSRLGMVLAVPGIAVLAIYGTDILVFLFGSEFAAAYPNLMLLGIGTAFYVAIFPLGPMVQIALGAGRYLAITAVGFLGFVLLACLGPLLFGIHGAGAGRIGNTIVVGFLSYMQIKRRLRRERTQAPA